MKLAEETGEVNAAVLRFYAAHGTEYKPNVVGLDIAEEAIDVIIVATSILCDGNLDITDADIRRLAAKKLEKWRRVLKETEMDALPVVDVLDLLEMRTPVRFEDHSKWCVNGCKHPKCPNL
jgi:hypothetical protein